MKPKKLIPYLIILLVISPIISCWVIFANPFHIVGKEQILDSLKDQSNGSILLTESYNGSIVEPYTVSVYQKKPSGQWVRYYIDHEAMYWWSGKLVNENGIYKVYCSSALFAEVDPQKQVIRDVGNNVVRQAFSVPNPFVKQKQ